MKLLRHHGWHTPEAAFDAMTATIGYLRIGKFVVVLNRKDGRTYNVEEE